MVTNFLLSGKKTRGFKSGKWRHFKFLSAGCIFRAASSAVRATPALTRVAVVGYLNAPLPVRGHLPEAGGLDDLLDELLEGAGHPLPGLGRGLDEHHLVLAGQLHALVLGDLAGPVEVTLKSDQKD